MNNKIMVLLGFVGGCAVGSIVTYFSVKKKFKKDAEIYIQQQLAEDRKQLREKYDDVITEKKEDIAKDAIDEYCEEVRKQRREYRDAAKKYQTSDAVFIPFESEPDESNVIVTKPPSNEPYIITEDDREFSDYDVKILFYHPDAYDVADEIGQLVDPSEYVGRKIFDDFAENNELDEIWVRNDIMKLDINLTKECVSR